MCAPSYIYVTIYLFSELLIFQKRNFVFLKMMLTYHISHEKIFSTALSVPGRFGVKFQIIYFSL